MKEEGQELNRKEAEKLYLQYTNGEELSEDELRAISGGETRDYATQGCAATVCYGSDCWGTDGGCFAINIEYEHEPLPVYCPECRATTVYLSYQSEGKACYICRSCGAEIIRPEIIDPWQQFL